MKNISAFVGALLTVGATSAAAQAPAQATGPDCSAFQKQLTDDDQNFQNQFQEDQDKGDQMKQDSATFNFHVGWSNQTIIFNVPSVTVQNKSMTFGVPQVTVNAKHIIFDTPQVKMVPTKTGQYPQTTCDTHTFIPKCTVTWHDIITSVPQTTMVHQDIVLGVPEFKLSNTTIVVGVPQFTNQQVKWVIGLPQFTLINAEVNQQKLQHESDDLQSDVANKKTNMAHVVGGDIHNMYGCYRTSLNTQRQQAASQYDAALAQLDAAIQSIKSAGADPSAVKDSDGNTVNMVDQRAKLAQQEADSLATFDAAAKGLDDNEKQAIANLTSS